MLPQRNQGVGYINFIFYHSIFFNFLIFRIETTLATNFMTPFQKLNYCIFVQIFLFKSHFQI